MQCITISGETFYWFTEVQCGQLSIPTGVLLTYADILHTSIIALLKNVRTQLRMGNKLGITEFLQGVTTKYCLQLLFTLYIRLKFVGEVTHSQTTTQTRRDSSPLNNGFTSVV